MFKVYEDTNRTWREFCDYFKDFRLNRLTWPKYKHLLFVLFWPIYGLVFYTYELILPNIPGWEFHPIYHVFDDKIPFMEIFVVPYYWWFLILAGMVAYTAFCNPEVFYRYMWFIALSYSIALICYAIYPSCQELRPDLTQIPRENIFKDFVQGMYDFDSNENVCPSIHVLGGFGACVAGLQCRRFRGWFWQFVMWSSMITIILSTVFIKQHSIIDLVLALVVCFVLYPFTFGRKKRFYTYEKDQEAVTTTSA